MTATVLANFFLSGSLLTMLVPIATVVAILTWGVLVIRRHERRRASSEAGDRAALEAADGSRPSGAP